MCDSDDTDFNTTTHDTDDSTNGNDYYNHNANADDTDDTNNDLSLIHI